MFDTEFVVLTADWGFTILGTRKRVEFPSQDSSFLRAKFAFCSFLNDFISFEGRFTTIFYLNEKCLCLMFSLSGSLNVKARQLKIHGNCRRIVPEI